MFKNWHAQHGRKIFVHIRREGRATGHDQS
jgi:hypothetical protein